MSEQRELTHGEEITNVILHGIGLGLAIAALVVLVVLATIFGTQRQIISFSIYGATLVLLYLSSTLYHSFPPGRVKKIFKIFDHAAIYLLIAGTYTPITLVTLRGTLGWGIFAVVWIIAIIGISFKIFFVDRFKILSTVLYIIMGWLIVIAIKPLFLSLNQTSKIFLVLGGVLYTVGTIFYAWRSLKYHHAVWHLFVLAGSICHFFTMLFLLLN
ncbi:MAG: hemolysin III family protein [Halanaerobacter sp.]